MISWRELQVVDVGGDPVKDEVRAGALALAFAAGTVSVLDPEGEPVRSEDVDWNGIEALGAEPIHGRNENNTWARAGDVTSEIVQDPRFPSVPAEEPEEVEV